MEKENIFGMMDNSIKILIRVNIKMIEEMVLESIYTRMEIFIKVIGKRAKSNLFYMQTWKGKAYSKCTCYLRNMEKR